MSENLAFKLATSEVDKKIQQQQNTANTVSQERMRPEDDEMKWIRG